MKTLLLPLLFTLKTTLCFAQFNVNLDRVNTLATDSTNNDFYFEKLVQQFLTKSSSLHNNQLLTLYYQPLNQIGSFKYKIITTDAYDIFKALKFKKLIKEYESYLDKMPANITLLFLLSLAYNEDKNGLEKSKIYASRFKQITQALIENKSLKNEDYLIELNSDIDEYFIMQILGIDKNLYELKTIFDGQNYIHYYTKNKDQIAFKILNHVID